MRKFGLHKWWFVTLLLTVPVVAIAQSVSTFTPGTVISSAAVNANFAALASRIAALESAAANAPVTTTTTLTFPGALGAAGIAREFTRTAATGDVLVFVSGTGFTSTNYLSVAIQLDGAALGTLNLTTNELNVHKTFPSKVFRIAPTLAAGSHSIALLNGADTTTDGTDNFNVVVVQLSR